MPWDDQTLTQSLTFQGACKLLTNGPVPSGLLAELKAVFDLGDTVLTALERTTKNLPVGPVVHLIFKVAKACADLPPNLIPAFKAERPNDADRLYAVYTILAFAAFFEALEAATKEYVVPIRLMEWEKHNLALNLLKKTEVGQTPLEVQLPRPPLPHPASGYQALTKDIKTWYESMTVRVERFFLGFADFHYSPDMFRNLPDSATRLFESFYLKLRADVPLFSEWAGLQEHKSLMDAITALRHQAELFDIGVALSELHANYELEANRAVYEYNGPLTFPSRSKMFVQQPFKVRIYDKGSLEWEETWTEIPNRSDLFELLSQLSSCPHASRRPILILGQPGSGKSLLCKILASSMFSPRAIAINVALRDIDPDQDFEQIIVREIERVYQSRITFGDLRRSLNGVPLLILLDGFDELLQVTGSAHSNFLLRLERFIDHCRERNIAASTIVTSRITLVDQCRVSQGSTVIRLEPFDDTRIAHCVDIWNATNIECGSAGFVPFLPPKADRPLLYELTTQPLLLVMLMIFSSEGATFDQKEDLSRTELYNRLIREFIRRELAKDSKFERLSDTEQGFLVDAELSRIGTAALGMFLRRSLWISSSELASDLEYFRFKSKPGARVADLSRAEGVLREFFFVYSNKAKVLDRANFTYEFLHNTFGEFLAGWFIHRWLVVEALEMCACDSEWDRLRHLAGKPGREWFTCLAVAPLHRRPLVVDTIRSLVKSHDSVTVSKLKDGLDTILRHHVQSVFSGDGLGFIIDSSAELCVPSLPLLGRLAMYTLNLLVLRLGIWEEALSLETWEWGSTVDGVSPWQAIVHLWMSWFSTDELAHLDGQLRATTQGTTVTLDARRIEEAKVTAEELVAYLMDDRNLIYLVTLGRRAPLGRGVDESRLGD